MKDFNWRRLVWVLITLGSAFMVWLGLVLGAVSADAWERFAWVMSVPLWATMLRNSIETLELMAWERLTREHAGKLLLGVMAAIMEQERVKAQQYHVRGDDDGARLMREISEALRK